MTVHDVGEIEGRPYMAMELLDGQPLAEEMRGNELNGGKALPVREVVVMAIQLANALAYAHARGIVHRDIKPGNLLRVAGSSTIKVTDFGIAHMDSAGGALRTRVGDILGTPQYMSPQQAQGEKLDGRSDLFSTGILLYQMLSGQRPFLGDGLVALGRRRCRAGRRVVRSWDLRRSRGPGASGALASPATVASIDPELIAIVRAAPPSGRDAVTSWKYIGVNAPLLRVEP